MWVSRQPICCCAYFGFNERRYRSIEGCTTTVLSYGKFGLETTTTSHAALAPTYRGGYIGCVGREGATDTRSLSRRGGRGLPTRACVKRSLLHELPNSKGSFYIEGFVHSLPNTKVEFLVPFKKLYIRSQRRERYLLKEI